MCDMKMYSNAARLGHLVICTVLVLQAKLFWTKSCMHATNAIWTEWTRTAIPIYGSYIERKIARLISLIPFAYDLQDGLKALG